MSTERVRAILAKLGRGRGALRGDGLAERVARQAQLTIVEVRQAFRELRNSGELVCDHWFHGEPIGRTLVSLATDADPAWIQNWAQVVTGAGLSKSDSDAFLALGASLEGFDRDAMLCLLAGLLHLREEQDTLAGTPRFEVSARYLLGSSKLLDNLPSAVLRRLGLRLELFAGPPAYLIVAGPTKPQSVVLVENPHAFEVAVRSPGLECTAWICTFGYGLSVRSDQHGAQLAEVIGAGAAYELLVRAGTPPALEQLLSHEALFFWGDLDPEGVRIFERLRQRLPQLRLSALYEPMVEALRAPFLRHPYCHATGKHGQQGARLVVHSSRCALPPASTKSSFPPTSSGRGALSLWSLLRR